MQTLYGLPEDVKFCKTCVISNQRPSSSVEFKSKKNSSKQTIEFDDNGICSACLISKEKENTDWVAREKELLLLLDKHRSKDGSYDCLVPGSGGKDSAFQSHVLKYKYGMNPLTITWPPILYTEYGYANWKSWIDSGFDNIAFTRNGKVMKLLTKLSIENLLHPFQTFILGQKNLAPKIAAQYGINLIFYGENEAEYGNSIKDYKTSITKKSYYTFKNFEDIYLAGLSIKELMQRYNLTIGDLSPFLPIDENTFRKNPVSIHYLGYYLKWIPQEVYYYAVENTGFKARPFRTQGTYSKYNSIDDKIDDLHYYTTFIKFGLGRASYDAAQEIRNRHLTREEGVALVNRFDGEFPSRYFQEIMDYLEMNPEAFMDLCDKGRSPHLWEKQGGDWRLKHKLS